MCRIAGAINRKRGSRFDPEILERVGGHLSSGGPDGIGSYSSGHVSFMHGRLAVIDISPGGHQPMTVGPLTLNYNGEVYNYRELRSQLIQLGHTFQSTSDTEVLLIALKQWGKSALHRLKGMFAFALWNEERETLLLARDPLGIKPLYYSQTNSSFLFASEMKVLREFPDHDASINHNTIGEYLSRGYISAPDTVYQNTHKLRQGEWLELKATTGEITKGIFFDHSSCRKQPKEKNPVDRFRSIFENSCRRRLQSDVPVGVLLSGGVDSSLIAATLSGLTKEPVKTFTMGFDDPVFDEAPRAAAIAKHLKTDHTEFYCNVDDFLRLIPVYADIYDEPFGDASGIATHLLAEGTSQTVKCCLGGDGGDELFGGYAKYRATVNFERYLKKIPFAARKLMADSIRFGRPDRLSRLLKKSGLLVVNTEEKLYKLAESITATSAEFFFQQASDYTDQSVLSRLGVLPKSRREKHWGSAELLSEMGMDDLQNFMEGDLMVKVDRASMYNGLEVRLPFLDTDLIAFAMTLPPGYKLRGRKAKILPRQLLAASLPEKLIDGPKRGFTIPLDRWLRTKLVDRLQDMAADQSFIKRFQFKPGSVEGIIKDYLSPSSYINAYPVWFLFVLHQWHIRWAE